MSFYQQNQQQDMGLNSKLNQSILKYNEELYDFTLQQSYAHLQQFYSNPIDQLQQYLEVLKTFQDKLKVEQLATYKAIQAITDKVGLTYQDNIKKAFENHQKKSSEPSLKSNDQKPILPRQQNILQQDSQRSDYIFSEDSQNNTQQIKPFQTDKGNHSQAQSSPKISKQNRTQIPTSNFNQEINKQEAVDKQQDQRLEHDIKRQNSLDKIDNNSANSPNVTENQSIIVDGRQDGSSLLPLGKRTQQQKGDSNILTQEQEQFQRDKENIIANQTDSPQEEKDILIANKVKRKDNTRKVKLPYDVDTLNQRIANMKWNDQNSLSTTPDKQKNQQNNIFGALNKAQLKQQREHEKIKFALDKERQKNQKVDIEVQANPQNQIFQKSHLQFKDEQQQSQELKNSQGSEVAPQIDQPNNASVQKNIFSSSLFHDNQIVQNQQRNALQMKDNIQAPNQGITQRQERVQQGIQSGKINKNFLFQDSFQQFSRQTSELYENDYKANMDEPGANSKDQEKKEAPFVLKITSLQEKAKLEKQRNQRRVQPFDGIAIQEEASSQSEINSVNLQPKSFLYDDKTKDIQGNCNSDPNNLQTDQLLKDTETNNQGKQNIQQFRFDLDMDQKRHSLATQDIINNITRMQDRYLCQNLNPSQIDKQTQGTFIQKDTQQEELSKIKEDGLLSISGLVNNDNNISGEEFYSPTKINEQSTQFFSSLNLNNNVNSPSKPPQQQNEPLNNQIQNEILPQNANHRSVSNQESPNQNNQQSINEQYDVLRKYYQNKQNRHWVPADSQFEDLDSSNDLEQDISSLTTSFRESSKSNKTLKKGIQLPGQDSSPTVNKQGSSEGTEKSANSLDKQKHRNKKFKAQTDSNLRNRDSQGLGDMNQQVSTPTEPLSQRQNQDIHQKQYNKNQNQQQISGNNKMQQNDFNAGGTISPLQQKDVQFFKEKFYKIGNLRDISQAGLAENNKAFELNIQNDTNLQQADNIKKVTNQDSLIGAKQTNQAKVKKPNGPKRQTKQQDLNIEGFKDQQSESYSQGLLSALAQNDIFQTEPDQNSQGVLQSLSLLNNSTLTNLQMFGSQSNASLDFGNKQDSSTQQWLKSTHSNSSTKPSNKEINQKSNKDLNQDLKLKQNHASTQSFSTSNNENSQNEQIQNDKSRTGSAQGKQASAKNSTYMNNQDNSNNQDNPFSYQDKIDHNINNLENLFNSHHNSSEDGFVASGGSFDLLKQIYNNSFPQGKSEKQSQDFMQGHSQSQDIQYQNKRMNSTQKMQSQIDMDNIQGGYQKDVQKQGLSQTYANVQQLSSMLGSQQDSALHKINTQTGFQKLPDKMFPQGGTLQRSNSKQQNYQFNHSNSNHNNEQSSNSTSKRKLNSPNQQEAFAPSNTKQAGKNLNNNILQQQQKQDQKKLEQQDINRFNNENIHIGNYNVAKETQNPDKKNLVKHNSDKNNMVNSGDSNNRSHNNINNKEQRLLNQNQEQHSAQQQPVQKAGSLQNDRNSSRIEKMYKKKSSDESSFDGNLRGKALEDEGAKKLEEIYQTGLSKVESYRMQGNQIFNQENYAEAFKLYTQGIQQLQEIQEKLQNYSTESGASTNKLSNKFQDEIATYFATLYTNRAAVQLMLNAPISAYYDCQMSLQSNNRYLKAHIRHATCLVRMGLVNKAVSSLEQTYTHLDAQCNQQFGSGHQYVLQLRQLEIDKQNIAQKLEEVKEILEQMKRVVEYNQQNDDVNKVQESYLLANDLTSQIQFSVDLWSIQVMLLLKSSRIQQAIQFIEQKLDYFGGSLGNEIIGSKETFYWLQAQCYFLYNDQAKLIHTLNQIKESRSGNQSQAQDYGTFESDEISLKLLSILPKIPSYEIIDDLQVQIQKSKEFKDEGNSLFNQRRYKDAIDVYTEGLDKSEVISPNYSSIIYNNRAACYMQLNQHSEAIADCLRAKALNPNYFKAHTRLLSLFEASHHYGLAVSCIEDIQTQFSNSLGQAEQQQQQLKFQQLQQKILTNQSNMSNSYQILGLSDESSTDDVRKQYKKLALKFHPDKTLTSCRYTLTLGKSGIIPMYLKESTTQTITKGADLLFKMIVEAHDVLIDRSKRIELNAFLLTVDRDNQLNRRRWYTKAGDKKLHRTYSSFSDISEFESYDFSAYDPFWNSNNPNQHSPNYSTPPKNQKQKSPFKYKSKRGARNRNAQQNQNFDGKFDMSSFDQFQSGGDFSLHQMRDIFKDFMDQEKVENQDHDSGSSLCSQIQREIDSELDYSTDYKQGDEINSDSEGFASQGTFTHFQRIGMNVDQQFVSQAIDQMAGAELQPDLRHNNLDYSYSTQGTHYDSYLQQLNYVSNMQAATQGQASIPEVSIENLIRKVQDDLRDTQKGVKPILKQNSKGSIMEQLYTDTEGSEKIKTYQDKHKSKRNTLNESRYKKKIFGDIQNLKQKQNAKDGNVPDNDKSAEKIQNQVPNQINKEKKGKNSSHLNMDPGGSVDTQWQDQQDLFKISGKVPYQQDIRNLDQFKYSNNKGKEQSKVFDQSSNATQGSNSYISTNTQSTLNDLNVPQYPGGLDLYGDGIQNNNKRNVKNPVPQQDFTV